MKAAEPLDMARVLEPLKDFQRRSVDYIFNRLYGANPTKRFLLADEVGLGKTLVARGVIARAIEHLQKKGVERIDIIYICSNGDIARQNINRLNVTGEDEFKLATRITLLPMQIKELEKRPLNFVSFTPDTSFNLRSNLGIGKVRWMLYWMLKQTWPRLMEGTAPMNILQGHMDREKFREMIRTLDPDGIDKTLAKKFRRRLIDEDRLAREEGRKTYRQRFKDLCQTFRYSRSTIPQNERLERNQFVGDLRTLLAATCVQSLEPDLIILDEFQRFKNLLRPDDPAGELARHLFSWGDARVLLLSATPYKMYTLSSEAGDDDHYKDFIDTLKFLFHDPQMCDQVQAELRRYRQAAYQLGRNGFVEMISAKEALQSSLRKVMVRTERLAVTEDRSGMLREVASAAPMLASKHIHGYLEIQKVATLLKQPNVLEYWKSSPYLLNFMEQYQLKQTFRKAAENGSSSELNESLKRSQHTLFPAELWRGYKRVDPGNAMMQDLMDQTLDQGWWRLLWMPTPLSYYQPAGPFNDVDAFRMTKRLVFSSWNVVPRAISILLSYEADRRMVMSLDPKSENTPEDRKRRRALLNFARSRDRLTGMPVVGFMYPCMALAELQDGLTPCSKPEPLHAVVERIQQKITSLLGPLTGGATDTGPEDESWYWATPILLDRAHRKEDCESWFEDCQELAKDWAYSSDDDDDTLFLEHLLEARRVALGEWKPEGRVPVDLSEVLAHLALAGPGICSLRALSRVNNDRASRNQPQVRKAAARMAWAFRSLFNIPEVICLIRGMDDREPYWRRVLEYCAQGCLQSVLDDYVHVLLESLGLLGKDSVSVAKEISQDATQAIGMRAATPGLDVISVGRNGQSITIENQRSRARFAMRFGQEKVDDARDQNFRADHVRKAFNSPFWPFVLATTTIGQEGLDFHPYCHAVVHWNLPSNPVDLEQREGRVHRYMGHAVRKNLARAHAHEIQSLPVNTDPWKCLFEAARKNPKHPSDLSPYWVYPLEDGAAIERHVPAFPLSRESIKLPALRRSLAVYRMVFGQPRQDDLVAYLLRQLGPEKLKEISAIMKIDLSPDADA